MSEFKQNISIDLFSTPGSFATNKFSARGITRSVNSDITFSHEFSNARKWLSQSERASESGRISPSENRNRLDSPGKEEKSDIRNTRERASEAENSSKSAMAVEENQNKRSPQEESKSGTEIDESRNHQKQNSTSDQDSETTDADKSNNLSEDIENNSLVSDETEGKSEQVDTDLLNVSGTDELSENTASVAMNENVAVADGSEEEITGVRSEPADKDNQNSATASEDNSAIAAVIGMGNILASGKNETPEEHISSELLAGRKRQSTNNSVVQEKLSATDTSSMAKTVGAVNDDVATSSNAVAASLLSSAQDNGKKLTGNVVAQNPKSVGINVDENVTNINETGKVSSVAVERQLKEADARRAELQNAAIIESKKQSEKADLQQTQLNQMQAKQLERQAMQNLNTTVLPVNSDTATQDRNVIDNMFLSSRGGIVTAPVVNRPESGSNAAINAPINTPILQQDADKAMAANIRWMTSEGVKNAVVNVTPSGMGPISVSVGLENDQMTVSIVASQSATREALDSLIPRLRDQLVAQGNENVRVDISDGKSDNTNNAFGKQDLEGGNRSHGQGEVRDEPQGSKKSEELMDTGRSELTTLSEGIITIDDIRRGNRKFDIYV